MTNESRIKLVAEFSRSRRVLGNRTLLDFDVTDLLVRPLLRQWRFSSGRLWDLVGVALVLNGLARQRPFRANLAGIKGLVLVGERDWLARRRLTVGLQNAGCGWPVAQLAGLGHNPLWHPATVRAPVSYIPTFV